MENANQFVLWLLFAAGQTAHILKRASMAVRSKTNSIRSRREYFVFCWDILLIRIALCSSLFCWALYRPDFIRHLVELLGVNLQVDFRIDTGTALVVGYFADSILDWMVSRIPLLQRELPPVSDDTSQRIGSSP